MRQPFLECIFWFKNVIKSTRTCNTNIWIMIRVVVPIMDEKVPLTIDHTILITFAIK